MFKADKRQKWLLLLLCSCGKEHPQPALREPITRSHDEHHYTIPETSYTPPDPYVWESSCSN